MARAAGRNWHVLCLVRNRKIERQAMEPFSPELALHWLADHTSGADDNLIDRKAEEPLTPSQEAALVALAERVSAARSVY
jgi:hypothetical protein